jgi:hypothetical protein
MKCSIFELTAALLLFCAASAHAQLRPLEPIDFHSFERERVSVTVGAGVFADQRAALAGTRGTLWEVGNVTISIRSGRMVMVMAGTIQRFFHDDVVLDTPYGDARPPGPDRDRHDSGDYRVSTVLRLSPESARQLIVLRFGTRLPTTDNRVGLDRDATDFFATLGVRRVIRAFAISAEAGVSINGTRKPDYEQADVLAYVVTGELNLEGWRPYVVVLGQEDLHDWAVRGNEDLGEVRVGATIGRRHRLDIAFISGYREFSPSRGLLLSGHFFPR